jgi:L-asparaginase II
MFVARSIAKRIQYMPKGRPFLGGLFAQSGSRASVNKALSRLVKAGALERVVRGVYMRPKASMYTGAVRASPLTVMRLMTKANGETVQVHGAEAVRLMGLSTQMQVLSTSYTSGSTRKIHVGTATVRLQHASKNRFQHAKTKVAVALTALHNVGKEALSLE